jgi:hypothetical protein
MLCQRQQQMWVPFTAITALLSSSSPTQMSLSKALNTSNTLEITATSVLWVACSAKACADVCLQE